MAYSVDDPWAVGDNDEDVAMAGETWTLWMSRRMNVSVLFPTYTPVQGGSPSKRGMLFCMAVLTLIIRPKLKRIKLCVHQRCAVLPRP